MLIMNFDQLVAKKIDVVIEKEVCKLHIKFAW